MVLTAIQSRAEIRKRIAAINSAAEKIMRDKASMGKFLKKIDPDFKTRKPLRSGK